MPNGLRRPTKRLVAFSPISRLFFPSLQVRPVVCGSAPTWLAVRVLA